MSQKACLNRRNFLTHTAALGTLAIGSNLLQIIPASADKLAKITMQLGWLISNGQLGEVMAIKNGYYADEGLELDIVAGGPNVDGVAGVVAGQSNVGLVTSSPSVMLARAAGMPVKAIAAGYQQHPYTYFSLKKNPVNKPTDMIGKTVAAQPTGFILLRALLAKHNIPEDKINLISMGSDMNLLMTGQADVVTGWLTNINALNVIGDERVDLTLWDSGIQLYANVYYTTDAQLADYKKELAGFIAATAKGWVYARDNQEEAVDALVKAYPNMDRESELEAIGPLMKFVFNENTEKNGWGAMSLENWETQIKTYAELDQFKGPPPTVNEIVSMELLEATADIRKKLG